MKLRVNDRKKYNMTHLSTTLYNIIVEQNNYKHVILYNTPPPPPHKTLKNYLHVPVNLVW